MNTAPCGSRTTVKPPLSPTEMGPTTTVPPSSATRPALHTRREARLAAKAPLRATAVGFTRKGNIRELRAGTRRPRLERGNRERETKHTGPDAKTPSASRELASTGKELNLLLPLKQH